MEIKNYNNDIPDDYYEVMSILQDRNGTLITLDGINNEVKIRFGAVDSICDNDEWSRMETYLNGKTKELNEILDTDDGARYIGEFAFGLNPYVNNTMCDTLFDEKINGSFHLTPGMALEESDNGNRSAIHWDIVKILRKEFGGGKIYFDDILIMQDGKFTLEELKKLNAENLK